MKAFETLGTVLTVICWNILPCVLIAMNFLFHIEQGRKEKLSELRRAAASRGETSTGIYAKFPVWVYLVAILIVGGFMNLCYWLVDLKIAIIPALVGVVLALVVLFYEIAIARAPYQAKAWSHLGIGASFIITYSLMGLNGGPKFFIICAILLLLFWGIGKVVARMLESGSIVRGSLRETLHAGGGLTPQTITTIAIILVAVVVLIFIL